MNLKEGENMFIETQERLINLSNVSNINILNKSNRIVFNLNYHIKIDSKQNKQNNNFASKLISDYVYWDAKDSEEFQKNIDTIKKNKFFKENFISKLYDTGYIKVDEISTIKFIDETQRVVFNFSHPVSLNPSYSTNITSEFLYVDCKTKTDYSDYKNYVYNNLSFQ